MKIADVRNRMSRIKQEKRKYKSDIVYLGEEIQKKINHWNELLSTKYSNIEADDKRASENRHAEQVEQTTHDECNRIEIDALSKAIAKRNVIIGELEVLLMQLTAEISESAIVINKIVNNFANRETNFAEHLDKLQKQLARIVGKSEASSNAKDANSTKRHKNREQKTTTQWNPSEILQASLLEGHYYWMMK